MMVSTFKEGKMAQEPAEIRARIKAEGESLKENFEEIGSRVKDALDWRIWYRNNTALALGGAVAGGLALSLLIGSGSSNQPRFIYDEMDLDEEGSLAPGARPIQGEPKSVSRLHQLADNTMSAVLGVATDKFQDFMSKALPGFAEHYANAQRKRFG
jgi:hypothetical protein